MKLCKIFLVTILLIVFQDSFTNRFLYSKAPMSLEEIKQELSQENLWIRYRLENTIYINKIDGSDPTVLYEYLGPEGSELIGFMNTENNKKIMLNIKDGKYHSYCMYDRQKKR